MTATDDTENPKTCFKCPYFETVGGNTYGICVFDSYINGVDTYWLVRWVLPYDTACEHFQEVKR